MEWDWESELHLDVEVVTWQSHLHINWKCDVAGDISSSNESLGSVATVKWLAATTFFWFQNVDFSLAVTTHINTIRFGEALAASNLFFGHTT